MADVIQFDAVTRGNFPELKALVLEQAGHHGVPYTGDDEKFIAAIERKDPVARILLLRENAEGTPLGYVLFNENFGFKGREVYLEDVLVSSVARRRGAGQNMMQAMKDFARAQDADAMGWTVTRQNLSAIFFYTRVGAKPAGTAIYDCAAALSHLPPSPAGYTARQADATDLDHIESLAGVIKTLTPEVVRNIRAAAAAPHARVYVSTGDDGTPKAAAIVNSNFSSFRTVYGRKMEMMELAATDTADACNAFQSLAARIAADAVAEDHAGHLNLFIDKSSLAQARFAQTPGFTPLMMSADPASFLDTYGMGRDIIHPQPKSAPLSGPKKAMGGP